MAFIQTIAGFGFNILWLAPQFVAFIATILVLAAMNIVKTLHEMGAHELFMQLVDFFARPLSRYMR